MTRIMSLCTGIGGLELACRTVFGETVELAASFEIDKHAQTVIGHRWPDAAQLGDIRGDDHLPYVDKVDVLTAGFPCQDISLAGKGAGLDGERSALWFDVLRIIEDVRPAVVLVENVAALERRGLDVVLDGLTRAGYGGGWCTFRSGYRSKNPQRFPHVNAPHQRKRLFVWAERDMAGGFREVPAVHAMDAGDVGTLFPTPAASNYGSNQGGAAGRVGPKRYGLSNIDKLLPTPTAQQGRNATAGRKPGAVFNTGTTLQDVAYGDKWGDYAEAVERWAAIWGPPPAPTTPEGKLNPALPEWMMGFPTGWVTDLDIPRTQQLKMLGNAVQPQTAAAAFRHLRDTV